MLLEFKSLQIILKDLKRIKLDEIFKLYILSFFEIKQKKKKYFKSNEIDYEQKL